MASDRFLAKLTVTSSDPASEERSVTEMTFIGPDKLTEADGHRVHTANCIRVVQRPEAMVEIGLCYNNGERIVLLTSVRIHAGFVPELIDELSKSTPN